MDRYVTRRFERTVMSAGEKAKMKELIAFGKKQGMSMKDASFGDFCPSCNGATKK